MSETGHVPPTAPSPVGPQTGWPTTPPPTRPLGPSDPAAIGPYRLEAVLGAGGMGRVYLAHTPAGTAVAVKVVHREYAADQTFRKRFEQEVATAKRVHGLYTAPVIDADLHADEPWLVTAYIPGPSLQHAVAEHGPLPVDATLALIARAAEALQSIHAANIIHRDLKPSNVILTSDGPKVIDFGIARAAELTSITGTNGMPGTPAYMAPEHILGHTLTPAADVFALGLVANFATTGKLAFNGQSVPTVIHQILQQAPDLTACPEPVRGIAAVCLEKDPQRRPTPAEIIGYCRQGFAGTPAQGAATVFPIAPPRPDTRYYTRTAPRPQRLTRRRVLLAGLVGGAGIGAAFAIPAIWSSVETSSLPQLPLVATLAGHPRVQSVAFSPDGKVLATGGSDGAKLWDAAGYQELATLGEDLVYGVAFSPDGKTLATGLQQSGVTLWDVASRQEITALGAVGAESVVFSPDGRMVAAAGYTSDVVSLVDVASRQTIGTLAGHDKGVICVALSPDGRTLASAGEDDTVKLWDVATRRELGTLDHKGGVGAVYIDDVAFSPDGRTLASTGGDDEIKLWDVATRQEIDTLTGLGESALCLAFSPDGKTLATGTNKDSAVTLWDMASRRRIARTVTGHTSSVTGVAFSPDGRTLATASEFSEQNAAQLWRVG